MAENHSVYCVESLVNEFNECIENIIKSYKPGMPNDQLAKSNELINTVAKFTFCMLTGSYLDNETNAVGGFFDNDQKSDEKEKFIVDNHNNKYLPIDVNELVILDQENGKLHIYISTDALIGITRLKKDWKFYINHKDLYYIKNATSTIVNCGSLVIVAGLVANM
jgi:hypothetical protein